MPTQRACLDPRTKHRNSIKNDATTKSTDDMATLYQHPKGLEFDIDGCGEQRNIGVMSTKVLHEPEDEKPAITLTTYKHGLALRERSDSLLQLFEPINSSAFLDKTSTGFGNLGAKSLRAKEEAEQTGLVSLRAQLENHFTQLKSAFEEKTGRAWIPLKPWRKEDCEWDWGSDNGEEAGWLDEMVA
ncbi:hypothetical protein EK21DRAFT_111052 [Setomelanomma holmii]|uniref:Uncharacterized protein n=1 Tax=Setomelanomma holmii TaxID=210430 RepID=A0A9P4LNG9_9PLEO|nr:hypothetical protein EK21DRAFT_111052 [Setomelanomma holmii]